MKIYYYLINMYGCLFFGKLIRKAYKKRTNKRELIIFGI